MRTRVLVTDAEYKNSLAAIRSLGAAGYEVVAGSVTRRAQGFYSRYASETVVYTSPRNELAFCQFLNEYAITHEIDVILPIGYLATKALSQHRDVMAPGIGIPVAPGQAMQIAADKSLTLPFASRVGIDVPRQYSTAAEVTHFPVVFKASLESGSVRYVNSREELQAIDLSSGVVQEYIPGEGFGFYGLFDSGQPRAVFMHRRLREYPVTGGSSTAAEAIYDPILRDLGIELLRALNWHGVAMVEFKKDSRDGKYKLMEVNPKFWGSLDLSIAAGVDFPDLAVKVAMGEAFEPVVTYDVGTKFRWVFDDFLHILAKPTDTGAFLRDFWNPRVHSDLMLKDWKPNAFAAAVTAKNILNHIRNGTLRRPHGNPMVRVER